MGGQGRSWTGTGAAVGVLVLVSCAAFLSFGSAQARQKAGPITRRGVASAVTSAGFTLQTGSFGTYFVQVTRDTAITEKGKHGRQSIRASEHVGVHGFAYGRNIRAIYVHIYASTAAPKGYTLTGTVQSAGGGYVVVLTGSKAVRIAVGSQTAIRVGSVVGRARDVTPGEKVKVHVVPSGKGLTATSVHVYKTQGVSQQVVGTVTGTTAGSLSVRQGRTTYRITLTPSTRVYLGASQTTALELRPGETVRVYACCQGQPLVAHSIHIKRVTQVRTTVKLAGTVTFIGRLSLGIRNGGATLQIAVTTGTIFEVGSVRVTLAGIRVGDQVTVRAYRDATAVVATRVHVLAASRVLHTIKGTVNAVSSGHLLVTARGREYQVVVSNSVAITLGGTRVPLSRVQKGDHVTVTGRLMGTTLMATGVSATRIPPRTRVIHGTVTTVLAGGFVLTSSSGQRYRVTLRKGVRPLMSGSIAPRDALFVGVHASVRGILSARYGLLASSVVLTVRVESLAGRVNGVKAGTLTASQSSGAVRTVDVPQDVEIADGRARYGLLSLHVGAYVRVSGYAESSGRIRASSIHVAHPALDVTGALTRVSPVPVLYLSSGDTYNLSLTGATSIMATRTEMPLRVRDLPTGAHVHVTGKMRSDGSLGVARMLVTLQSVTVEGAIQSITASALIVGTPTGSQKVRTGSLSSVLQGTRSLDLASLVVGDDVTVTGYSAAHGWIIGRKLEVHRKLVGLDGYVSQVNGDTFTLTLATGTGVQVQLSDTTQVSGGIIAMDLNLHVTGYQRGDGVVLATRVRVGKPHA